MIERITIKTKGMTCGSCEKIISRELTKHKGIKSVEASFKDSVVIVEFEPSEINEEKIREIIESKGYECSCDIPEDKPKKDWFGIISIALGAFAILFSLVYLLDANGIYLLSNLADQLKIAESVFSMSGNDIGTGTFALLFLAGILTSFHCVAMCGGFVVSYTTKAVENNKKPYLSHVKYGAGKMISYTIIGGLFGLFGSIFAFTPGLRGAIAIIAGLFLIIYGLNMLGYLLFFRKLHLKLPKFMRNKINDRKEDKGPFVIGLLNGLFIACGPLQAMYVMAAGTGSLIKGAEILLFFGLGTLPLLLGFGTLTTFISSKVTHKILKLSGAIVIILGLFLLSSGVVLTGNSVIPNLNSANSVNGDNTAINKNSETQVIPKGYALAELKDDYQVIRMNVTSSGWKPDKFVLYNGIKVKWIIDGQEITGCNNAIQVPKYNLKFSVKRGIQTIEFTPTETGNVQWSCWMGMIQGKFLVVEKTK